MVKHRLLIPKCEEIMNGRITYESKYDSLLSITVKCGRPRRGVKPLDIAGTKPSVVRSWSPERTKWKLDWKDVFTEC